MIPELNLSKNLDDLLSGKVTPQEADPRILNWAEFAIWQGACEILRLPTTQQRRNALNKVPETIRPIMEREVKRMFTLRRG